MPSTIDNGINSAIASGLYGLNSASKGIEQASLNIAQRTTQQNPAETGPAALLKEASADGLENLKGTLPQPAGNLTSDLVSLQVNGINAQASAKVLDTAFDTVGTIIDTLA
ncbi:hypothetical protein [Alteromonas sp. CYL-A6]|uniref:hypothetical protein n=1 Tax=Alteromonas nitratireducens TaxID=3390813 RepID=UPI0034BEB2D8